MTIKVGYTGSPIVSCVLAAFIYFTIMEPSVCQASDSILGVYIAVNRQMSTLELQEVSVPERGLSATSSCHSR